MSLKKLSLYSLVPGIILFLGIVGLFNLPHIASANPSHFLPTVKTAAATTTPNYLTPGTGTTTLTYDSYTTSIPDALDSAVLMVQFTGSSTASTLNIAIQYSDGGDDYYQDGQGWANYASSTKTFDISQIYQYSWQYASTSRAFLFGSNVTGTSTDYRIIRIPTPTRFVRAVFTLPQGSLNGAVWAKWLPEQENQN
jgi:hypothetical protein